MSVTMATTWVEGEDGVARETAIMKFNGEYIIASKSDVITNR